MRKYIHVQAPARGRAPAWVSLHAQACAMFEAKDMTSDWRYKYLKEMETRPEEALRRLSWISVQDLKRDIDHAS